MKYKIAIPYVQLDIYEVDAPEGAEDSEIIDAFNEALSDDSPRIETRDACRLDDWCEEECGEREPFVITEEYLNRFQVAVSPIMF